MMRLVISCLWVCVVTLASAYTAVVLKARQSDVSAKVEVEKINYDRTRPMNIPMIANGAVQGYVVIQFSYTADSHDGAESKQPIEAYILDEAFKTLYADDKLDFRHLEKYDIAGMMKNLVVKVNTRMNKQVLKDVLVDEFNYIPKEEISR